MTAQHRSSTFSRRHLLAGLGSAALVAPFLREGQAFAQGDNTVNNLIILTFPEGLETGWQPSGTDADLTLNDTMSPLEPFKRDMIFVDGLKGGANNIILQHAEGTLSLWTGSIVTDEVLKNYATFPSIDQAIANKIGASSPHKSLHFGVQANHQSVISNPYVHYSGSKQPVPAEDDPNAMYKLILGNLGGQNTASMDKLRAKKRSVLDYLASELGAVKTQVASVDRVKIDEHLDRIRTLEKTLDGSATSCSASPQAPALTAAEALKDENFTTVTHAQMDLLTLALQCGLTKVATLQLSNTDSQTHLPGMKGTRTVHDAEHSGTSPERVEINKYLITRIAYLLDRLKSTSLGNGKTLLDRTLVVMGSEMSVGGHGNDPIPFMLAGGGGARFKMGRHVKVPGTPRHTKLLTSIVRSYGLTDVETYGQFTDDDARGELAELG